MRAAAAHFTHLPGRSHPSKQPRTPGKGPFGPSRLFMQMSTLVLVMLRDSRAAAAIFPKRPGAPQKQALHPQCPAQLSGEGRWAANPSTPPHGCDSPGRVRSMSLHCRDGR